LDNLELFIESLVFTSGKAITVKELKLTLNSYLEAKISDKEIEESLVSLTQKYADDKYPFEIVGIANGYQFMTKGAYYPIISQYLKLESKKKLSRPALETLAVISYKQPITKSVIESIRGVNCDYSIQKLLEKELIEISGRAEGPGRPLLYVTSEKFMNHFGLKTLNDLPKIKEFEEPENSVGVADGDATPQLSTSVEEDSIPSTEAPTISTSEEE